jgi:hypothetical protein
MNAHRLFRACLTVLALATAVGCAADTKSQWQRPKVVHAGGVVRFQGQPLEGALVTFTNQMLSTSAFARTDAEGKFMLTTFEAEDGAVPGKHTVSVSKVQIPSQVMDKSTAPVWRNARTPPPPQPRWLIPKRYGNPSTSGLTVEVPEGGNTSIILELLGSP